MKTRFVVALAVVCSSLGVLTGGLVAHAGSTPGIPEIDRANVKVINLQGPTLTGARCTGEDAMAYITYTGGPFLGGVSQLLPDPTDYPLPANTMLTVSGIVWTVNVKTLRGVLTATVGIAPPASVGAPIYSGKLTLVTQGMPAAGALVPGRGWISAKSLLPDEGVTPGDDYLIANVEAKLGLAVGSLQFGNGVPSLNIPDYSVVTNVAPAPASDGVC